VFSIDLNIGNIVLEDGWDIDLAVEVISSYPSFLLVAAGKPSQIREGNSNQEQLRPPKSLTVEGDSIPLGKCLWRRR
jgi:hypothetical protein